MAHSFEYENKFASSVKGVRFLNGVSDHQLRRNYLVRWIYIS
jgi:hypothetical protein